MILAWLIIIPLLGGLAALVSNRFNTALPRVVSLFALAADLVLLVIMWMGTLNRPLDGWYARISKPLVPQLGIGFHLALDGLSLLFVLLTVFLAIAAVVSSWTEIRERTGFFHFNLLWVISGIIGTFLALDLIVFYFFWELMLVPMYFLIALWGHGNRHYASIKFFIFTQAGGLFMLLAILGLYFIHGNSTGVYSFDYMGLLGTTLERRHEFFLMLGFFLAFAVKLPVIPFHTWLPDAHTEAPTAGSVILAGLLLKTGAYGLIRFVVPLFPNASAEIAPLAMALAVIGIIYGAVLAFSQTDLKRLVAYTSVSHMGFVLLGIFAWNDAALKGAVMQSVCHGVSTGALFMLAGALQERIHTREIERMGGLWAAAPRMGAITLFFALASLGIPGLGNFIGEFLVLLGTFGVSTPAAIIAAFGLIASAVYALWLVQRVFHGTMEEGLKMNDLDLRETSAMAVMVLIIVWLGLMPQPLLDRAGQIYSQGQTRPVLEKTAVQDLFAKGESTHKDDSNISKNEAKR